MEKFWKRWSGQYWVIYYGAFFVVLLALVCRYWYALNWRDESWVPFLAGIFGVSAGAAFIFTILTESIGFMVLLIPERVRKLRAEGAAEERRKWQAWLERKAAAERAGLPFNEPPPDGAVDTQN